MEECDIFRGSKHTLTPPTYFQGVRTPPPAGSTPLNRKTILNLWIMVPSSVTLTESDL